MSALAGPLLAAAEIGFAGALLVESYIRTDLRDHIATWDAWFAALFVVVMWHGSLRSRAGAPGGT